MLHCPKITPLSYFPWKYPPPCENASVIVSTSCSRNHAHLCMSVPAECLYITSYFTSIMKGEEHRTCRYPLIPIFDVWKTPVWIWCAIKKTVPQVMHNNCVLERHTVSLPLCPPWSPSFYCTLTWVECWIRPLSLSCHADPMTPARLVNFFAGWVTSWFFQRQNSHILHACVGEAQEYWLKKGRFWWSIK